MRVAVIGVISTLFIVTILWGARQYGLQTPYQRFDHAFWNTPRPLFIVSTKDTNDIQKIIPNNPAVVPWLDVQMTSDHFLMIVPDQHIKDRLTQAAFAPSDWKGPHPHRYALSELRPLFPDAPLLPDILTQFAEQRFILNLPGEAPDLSEVLLATLDKLPVEKQILIRCETEGVLKELKEKKPQWLFSSSRADLMRWLSFDSIGLLPAIPFKYDVFIANQDEGDRQYDIEPLVQEAHRRKKDFLVGPLENKNAYEKAKAIDADGYIFSSVDLFLSLFEQKSL